jgi:hypothetical protein
MISQIQGIFQFKMKNHPEMFLIVQKNAMIHKYEDSFFSHKFDLKGSLINRKVLPPKTLSNSRTTYWDFCKRNVLKDQDLQNILKFKEPNLINISLEDKRKIIKSLKEDIGFFASQNIMDYSLLLSVEDRADQMANDSHLDHLTMSDNSRDLSLIMNHTGESLEKEGNSWEIKRDSKKRMMS